MVAKTKKSQPNESVELPLSTPVTPVPVKSKQQEEIDVLASEQEVTVIVPFEKGFKKMEFRCNTCNHTWEEFWFNVKDRPIWCPTCTQNPDWTRKLTKILSSMQIDYE